MSQRISIMALACVAVCASCATVVVESTRSEPAARPVRPRDHAVQVLEGGVPERQHKVIGSVRARVKLSEYGDRVAPKQAIVARLMDEARTLGGDALLGLAVRPTAGGGTYLSPEGSVLAGGSEIWSALVIVWTEP